MDGRQYSHCCWQRYYFDVGVKPPQTAHRTVADVLSRTLAATLYYLLNNPLALSKLEQEVRNTFLRAEDIHMGSQMQTCAWLRACIDETMRMTPAVGGLLPREVLRGGLSIPDLDINLPAGVNVGVCIYAIHHHPDYVHNPFIFDPNRWLHGDKQDREALHAVFNPFSLGHRGCLGKPLVYMELSIALARLVYEYDMRLAPDQHENKSVSKEIRQGKRDAGEYQLQDWFMSNNFGPYTEFKARRFEDRADSAIADCD